MAVRPRQRSGRSLRRTLKTVIFAPTIVLLASIFQAATAVEFVCPMDKDVRAQAPGKCYRCGMPLEAGVREPVEYRLGLKVKPGAVPVGKPVELQFELLNPVTNKRATRFEVVHEKLFHLFLVSADLEHFEHVHPEAMGDGRFRLRTTLPKAGIYRVLTDAYPTGATPQLIPAFLTTAGYAKSIGESMASPAADLGVQKGRNMEVSLRMEPANPLPGRKTMLFLSISPGTGLDQYLGAWGHMLAVSNDLVDSSHEHPAFAEVRQVDGKQEVQFNMFFPREATYRVWVQFQRLGVLNTVAFTIPVRDIR